MTTNHVQTFFFLLFTDFKFFCIADRLNVVVAQMTYDRQLQNVKIREIALWIGDFAKKCPIQFRSMEQNSPMKWCGELHQVHAGHRLLSRVWLIENHFNVRFYHASKRILAKISGKFEQLKYSWKNKFQNWRK